GRAAVSAGGRAGSRARAPRPSTSARNVPDGGVRERERIGVSRQHARGLHRAARRTARGLGRGSLRAARRARNRLSRLGGLVPPATSRISSSKSLIVLAGFPASWE